MLRNPQNNWHDLQCRSRNTLCQAYWYEGLDLWGIADKFSVSVFTVQRWFHEFNIPTRESGQSRELKTHPNPDRFLARLRNQPGFRQTTKLKGG